MEMRPEVSPAIPQLSSQGTGGSSQEAEQYRPGRCSEGRASVGLKATLRKHSQPGNKPTQTCSTNLRQRRQEHTMRKGQSLQQMVLGKLGSLMQNNKTGPLSYPKYKKEV